MQFLSGAQERGNGLTDRIRFELRSVVLPPFRPCRHRERLKFRLFHSGLPEKFRRHPAAAHAARFPAGLQCPE